jgi:hypothetical protein
VPRLLRLLLLLTALSVALIATLSQAGGPSAAVAGAPAELESRQILSSALSAPGTFAGSCHDRLRKGAPGAVVETVSIPAYGPIDARLDASSGDWDLAVFDADGRRLAAAAGADGQEIASGWAFKGGDLHVQACRRSGAGSDAKVTLRHATVPAEIEQRLLEQNVQMIDVKTPTKADEDRLSALGLDLTEHGGHGTMGVVLHGDADERKLRAAGFEFSVIEDDIVRRGVAERRAERRAAARATRSDVPSGRTSYRILADYENEMKTFAQQNPGLVRLITMPKKTWLGREVLGIEIAQNVNLNDGRPAFLNMGIHHAREWPSGEHAMEWAVELIKGFKDGDPRATKIVRQSRNIVVPVVNPDGFNASRTAGALTGGDEGRDESIPDTALIVSGAANGGEYRRKNCRVGDAQAGNCTTSAGLVEIGTDPNRNYGGLWGGPGAERNQATQTYPGPGPFSEPETQNIQWLVSRNQVMSLITNHTTAGLVLRAPGLRSLGDPVDENRGYKALGDAMALENGYFSQKSFELYDTTGTTEDWSYNATGGFGFTFEVYCGAPNYVSGDCDDPAFHPMYETMAKEWDGTSPQSDHEDDPGPNGRFGMQAGYDGKGNREAYYIAAESAINEQRHSVIEGDVPSGVTLRLTKAFKTETYPQPAGEGEEPKPILFDDKLETVYDVGDSGKFRWHINPSTRPIVAKDRGRDKNGEPSPPKPIAQTKQTVPCPPFFICGFANDDQTFTVPPQEPGVVDNGKARIRIEWGTQASDYDLKIFRPGAPPLDQAPLYQSVNKGTDFEEVVIPDPEGEYLIRVFNAGAVEPWTGQITYESPDPLVKGITENWTLSCELNGQVLQTTEVLIDRGEVKRPDLGVCDRRVRELRNAGSAPAPAASAPSTQAPPKRCTAGSGFRSVGVTPKGRGLRFSFARRVNAPVTVSVFQQSRGGRITGEQLVARFTGKRRGFTWSGKANRKRRSVGNGYLFARFSIRTRDGLDVRRLTLRRSRGRFVKRPDFYRRATCDALPSFKVERPVFGGRTNRPLNVSFRLADPSRVRVEVLKGNRRVRSFGPTNRRAGVTHRLRIDPKKLDKGEYRIRITVLTGARPLTATLVARRL